MSINSIFSTARNGVFVAQNAAALASRNLANANTPGYAREILPLAAALGGLGVVAGAPVAMRAALLERALQGASGRSAFHESQVAHLSIAEAAVNDLDGVGLGSSIEDFRSALSALSARPSGTIERDALIASGEALGAAFGAMREQLASAGEGIRADAVSTATQVNDLTARIARIDQKVRSARPGDEYNTFVAQRSALVDELSGLIDIDVRSASDGTLTVSTTGGRTLVDGASATEVVVSTSAPPEALTLGFKRGAVELDPIAGAELGGRLGGLFAAHEETVGPAIARLDALAFEFAAAFNDVHAQGFTADGSPGGPMFEPLTDVTGAAANLRIAPGFTASQVAASADPASPGDNSNLTRLMAVAGDGGLPGGGSLGGTWGSISTSISRALATATTGAEFEAASRDQLANLLASETGVSIDEEMFNLTLAQTALEASSKVIATAQQMTDTVLSLVG